MCGIAGLFIREKSLEPRLGVLLQGMTATLGGRGPDSAGFAVYSDGVAGRTKLTLQSKTGFQFDELARKFDAIMDDTLEVRRRHTHATFLVPSADVARLREWIGQYAPEVNIVSEGQRLEIFKDVGYPDDVAHAFRLSEMAGTHGIAHTRMATESAVTTDGAHPFSTGADQCLVHNGSLSNHASLRRQLRNDGILIQTENDSEVGAAYLTREMRSGKSLGDALKSSLEELDGFFTFVVGTESGFGVLRDPIACKPAVMAETDEYVAFASEYKSLTCLPGIERARVWEPKPATVYFWERS